MKHILLLESGELARLIRMSTREKPVQVTQTTRGAGIVYDLDSDEPLPWTLEEVMKFREDTPKLGKFV